MKTWRVGCVWLALVGHAALFAAADPAQVLRDAPEQLRRAGNYTWELKRQTGKVRAMRPASGATIIDGFTAAQCLGRESTSERFRWIDVMMLGDEFAYRISVGWRHANDLTETEAKALNARREGRVYALPHELLERLVAAAINVRKEAGAIVADLDPERLDSMTLSRYLIAGDRPQRDRRTLLGLATGVRSRPTQHHTHVLFRLSEANGTPERIEIEFSRDVRILNGPDAGDHRVSHEIHTFELRDIGTTSVAVEPEARAILLVK